MKRRAATKEERIGMCRERLQRLKRLRAVNAPRMIIKCEQIALIMNKRGKKYAGLGRPASKMQRELEMRHIVLVEE